MVYCGKLSKACERCRARRLKCDLRSGTCSSCARARVHCSGYRDTQELRIRDQSQSVAKKALRNAIAVEPRYLPLSIDLQARDAFFAYHVTSKCWNTLKPYYHPKDAPEHLILAIEAASLAYLWHQVYSDAALAAARERYVSALRMTKKALKCPNEAAQDTTLLASLLLDLFERITDEEPENSKSWISHFNGAFALVRLRGLATFQNPSDLTTLARLSTNCVTSCIASGSQVPDEVNVIQAYIGEHRHEQSPVLRLSGLMAQYANLRSEVQRGSLSNEERIEQFMKLDRKLQALDSDLESSWHYSTTLLDYESDRVFGLRYDSYPNSKICQARNFFRVVRILLNESLIDDYLASPTHNKNLALIAAGYATIEILARDICASVPQYVDCSGAVRQREHTPDKSETPDQTADYIFHAHTFSHQLDCYTLIFPLYVTGISKAAPQVRPWAIEQLHYMSSHFYIRNAKVVAQILDREEDVSPWVVFSMLGSYAFAC